METQLIKLSKLKNAKGNPRFIKDNKYKQLVQSIKEFPQMLEARPLVVNMKYEVLGGNMRLRACKELGIAEVPCVIVDYTEEQEKEFVIKDNISFGDWDWDILANEWPQEQLIEWGMDSYNFGASPDFLEVPDIDQIDVTPANPSGPVKEPTAATEGFVKLEIVLREDYKKEVVKLLNQIQTAQNCTMGDALYHGLISSNPHGK